MAEIIEIQDLALPELQVYASMTEPELRHIYEPKTGVFVAESPKVIERALQAGYEPLSLLMEKDKVRGENADLIAHAGEIPVYVGESSLLKKITGFQLTRGTLCCFRRRELPEVREVMGEARRIAILENVMNPTNVGAIFRSAAALNVDGILLTKGASDPLYRRAARVSMGTVFQIPWTYLPGEWPEDGLRILREAGFRTAAMALSDLSVPVSDERVRQEKKLAIVLGTEGEGLAAETIAGCDYTVRIPMTHGVDSLNVAAASAVGFYALCGEPGV